MTPEETIQAAQEMTDAEIRAALQLVDVQSAIPAAFEYELEELGLITINHEPYPKLTREGRAVMLNVKRSLMRLRDAPGR